MLNDCSGDIAWERGIDAEHECSVVDGIVRPVLGWTVRSYCLDDSVSLERPERDLKLFSSLMRNGPARTGLRADGVSDDCRRECEAAPQGLPARLRTDCPRSGHALLCLGSAVFWVILGSLAGLFSSVKMHLPGWLVNATWLTVRRIRPAHLRYRYGHLWLLLVRGRRHSALAKSSAAQDGIGWRPRCSRTSAPAGAIGTGSMRRGRCAFRSRRTLWNPRVSSRRRGPRDALPRGRLREVSLPDQEGLLRAD